MKTARKKDAQGENQNIRHNAKAQLEAISQAPRAAFGKWAPPKVASANPEEPLTAQPAVAAVSAATAQTSTAAAVSAATIPLDPHQPSIAPHPHPFCRHKRKCVVEAR